MKCILFDLDGVVIDSEPGAFGMFKSTLNKKGIDISMDTLMGYIGKTSSAIATEIVKIYDIDQTPEEFLQEHRSNGNYYADSDDLQPMLGLMDCLDSIKKKNISMGIVSSTRSNSVLAALNRLSLTKYFDVIVCGDMVQKNKPSPEGYIKAANYLNAKPTECLVIEDSPIGIQAGKNAGMKVIGFKGSVYEQDTSNADIEVKTFKEFMNLNIV